MGDLIFVFGTLVSVSLLILLFMFLILGIRFFLKNTK